jgi:hypothetical protein
MVMNRGEALARIKAEVMAPDWRLNQRRLEGLRLALAELAGGLGGRHNLGHLLAMAQAALVWQERYGESAPPAVLDFLKQALARLADLLEDEVASAERDAEIFNKVHARFIELRQLLAAGGVGRS